MRTPHYYDCRICVPDGSQRAADPAEYDDTTPYGIPVFAGDVLPNDWPHAWGGAPACPTCYAYQQTITRAHSIAVFRAAVVKIRERRSA